MRVNLIEPRLRRKQGNKIRRTREIREEKTMERKVCSFPKLCKLPTAAFSGIMGTTTAM